MSELIEPSQSELGISRVYHDSCKDNRIGVRLSATLGKVAVFSARKVGTNSFTGLVKVLRPSKILPTAFERVIRISHTDHVKTVNFLARSAEIVAKSTVAATTARELYGKKLCDAETSQLRWTRRTKESCKPKLRSLTTTPWQRQQHKGRRRWINDVNFVTV